MFERFTEAARAVVVGAQDEARSLGQGWIGTEHLLLAALADPDAPLARTLGALGLTHDGVRTEVLRLAGVGTDDASALRAIGIDLDDVRRRVEERFGPGALDRAVPPPRRGRLRRRRRRPAGPWRPGCALPFTGRTKKALELALREALHLHSREIRVEHVVLGTLRADGPATLALARLGVFPGDVRRAVLDQLRRAA